MASQVGMNRVRVSWIPPPNPPSKGYLITTVDTRPTDFSVGLMVLSGQSRDIAQAPGTNVSYWLVALYGTPIVVGPVSGTVRGEEMCKLYNQSQLNFK